MDREEAKFILSSFRPDGSDAKDEHFKEALELTVTDQELARWFVNERAFDSEFTDTLCSLDVPENLKGELCELMNDHLDSNSIEELAVIGALATIQPPKALKSEILHAMNAVVNDQESRQVVEDSPGLVKQPAKKKNIIKLWFPVAIAAVVAIATMLGIFTSNSQFLEESPLTASLLSTELSQVLSDEKMLLDFQDSNYLQTVSWANSEKIPTPSKIPTSLSGVPTIGCKKITLGGHSASLICFLSDGYGMLHLVVLERDVNNALVDALPALSEVKEHCYKCPMSGNLVAKWQDDEKIHVLLSKSSNVEKFQEIF